MTTGMGGIRTATMYLTAEAIGQKKQGTLIWILSGCIGYSMILSCSLAFVLYYFAPQIAVIWIGNGDTVGAIRLLAAFLPVNCLCGVMIGSFTGMNRIGTLVGIEVAEQLFSMIGTTLLLVLWADTDSTRACLSVIMGSGLGACFTLTTLLILKQREPMIPGKKMPMFKKLWETAVPLGIADDVKAGISTTENLMVPKRLSLYAGVSAPLAAYGMVCGMVFPVLMFPAAFLFGLAELLIPELARCTAAGSTARIQHLAERSLLLALIYGCFCGSILFLTADKLCMKLYREPAAGEYLRHYAILAPMLYCDAIVDAMTKGLGQQKICVRNNIITSAMDVGLLFILLPKYGMHGYFISFFITHLLNFVLSVRLLLKIVGKIAKIQTIVMCILSAIFSIMIGNLLFDRIFACYGFCIIFTALLFLLGVIKRRDLIWLKGLVFRNSFDNVTG